MKKLIVTADDAGLHPGMTAGAVAAHDAGIVTAVSVSPNGRAFDDAVARLRERPELDDVAWCAFGVHRGCEREVQLEVVEGDGECYLRPIGTVTNRVGCVSALTPPGDIHTVINPGPELAISIHVYGADVREVGTSIRRRYDLPVRVEEPVLVFAPALASGG